MKKPSIELTEAEWTIIKAVWAAEPCSAPDIQEKLRSKTAWTYSTVRTLMDRMVAKGLLSAGTVRHLTLFRSAVTREQAQRGELLYALKHAFNGALTPMVQCLLDTGGVSPRELAQLEALIKARKKSASANSRNPHPD
ncbi:MAG: BlaI/MecI/CopY family transcriptional regulator [Limisphaerales bacterium]